VDSIAVSDWDHVLACNPARGKLYCSAAAGDSLLIFDIATRAVLARLDAGTHVRSICCNPANDRVYVTNFYDNRLQIIDGIGDTILHTIEGIPHPCLLQLSPTGEKLYCLVGDDPPLLAVIDCARDSLLTLLPVGDDYDQAALDYNEADDRLYVTGYSGNSGCVTVVDGPSSAVVGTILVGEQPVALARAPRANRTFVSCLGSSALWVIHDAASAVDDRSPRPDGTRSGLAFQPNPGRGIFEVRFAPAAGAGPARLQVTDATGRLVRQLLIPHSAFATPHSVDLRVLPDGVYFVSLTDNPRSAVKLIISR
jgi:DNA-binding beta-propeller fold protein YncE